MTTLRAAALTALLFATLAHPASAQSKNDPGKPSPADQQKKADGKTPWVSRSPSSLEEEPLRIANILGVHRLTDKVSIDVSADTKGKIWYAVLIEGQAKGGAELDIKTAEEAVFWWDEAKSKLWIVTPHTICETKYTPNGTTSSHSAELSEIAGFPEAPEAVIAIVQEMKDARK